MTGGGPPSKSKVVPQVGTVMPKASDRRRAFSISGVLWVTLLPPRLGLAGVVAGAASGRAARAAVVAPSWRTVAAARILISTPAGACRTVAPAFVKAIAAARCRRARVIRSLSCLLRKDRVRSSGRCEGPGPRKLSGRS